MVRELVKALKMSPLPRPLKVLVEILYARAHIIRADNRLYPQTIFLPIGPEPSVVWKCLF
jgi:hypothetical protein